MLKFLPIRFSLFGRFHLHNLTALNLWLEQARRPADLRVYVYGACLKMIHVKDGIA
jgi:hypothetical protein